LTSTTSPAAADDDVDVDDTFCSTRTTDVGEINKILDSMRELEPRKSQLIVAAQF
tara:strand:+ start:371 stop:535 length:165 start_codon:yes stop_codon:yes gene_type:complete